MNNKALIGGAFGTGLAWPMSIYGWTVENLSLGVGNGLAIAAIIVILIGVVRGGRWISSKR